MHNFAVWWCDTLLRASVQGGLAVFGLLVITRVWKSIPASTLVWGWRLVLLKFILTLVAPVTIEKGRAVSSTGSAAPSLLPILILSLSAAGILLSAVVLLGEVFAIYQLRRERSSLLESVQEGKIDVKESKAVETPMLIGFGRPLILIPEGMASNHLPEYRMAVAHEVSHWQRKDLAWAWLAFLARSLFFFHPMVLVALKELNVATESACDEQALGSSGASRREYGLLLLKLSQRKELSNIPSVTFAAACSKDTLTRRIQFLAHPQKRATALGCTMFLGLVLVSLPSYRFLPTRQESPAFSPSKAASGPVFSPARMTSTSSTNNDFERRNFAQKNPTEGKQ